MYTRSSCFAEHAREILGCAILVPIFIISGCANKPNLIPEGYGAMIEKGVKGERIFKIVGKKAAELDYAIPVATMPNDKQIEIFWTKGGEIIWTEPFWTKVTYWRFALVALDAPDGTPAICYTQWKEVGSDDITNVPCDITAKDYIGKPLNGMLTYSYSPTMPKDDDVTPEETRRYYLVLK